MLQRSMRVLGLVCLVGFSNAGSSSANVPFPFYSTCTITITQFPVRTPCLSMNFFPDVVRLTPEGSTATPAFDRVSITVRARDANEVVVVGALVSLSEQSGIVNIADGGSTTAITDSEGLATIALHAASGYGRVALCADGVQICNVIVRSPDVTKSGAIALCGLGTSVSGVAGEDILNPRCGFLTNFGPVTPGENDGWDLNCDNNVNGSDVTGSLSKGGVLQYFGDTGTLGTVNNCP